MSIDDIELGRAAFDRHAWREAVEILRAAEGLGQLSGDDLERLAESEWWSGHPDEALDAYERAFARDIETGNADRAAGVALRLSYLAFRQQSAPVGGAWLARPRSSSRPSRSPACMHGSACLAWWRRSWPVVSPKVSSRPTG